MPIAREIRRNDSGELESTFIRVSDSLLSPELRNESERAALNIVRRIDEVSETWGRADDVNALANALAVLADIAKGR